MGKWWRRQPRKLTPGMVDDIEIRIVGRKSRLGAHATLGDGIEIKMTEITINVPADRVDDLSRGAHLFYHGDGYTAEVWAT